MNFYKIFIIYFFIIFSINAKNICSTQEKIYADKGLAKITLQLPERQKIPIEIKIHTPSHLLIGTDFPVVEATDLLDISTITNEEGLYDFELVFPIRGTYKIEIKDLGANQIYLCNLEVYEHPQELKNFYVLVTNLFIVGFISGIIIFQTNKNKIQIETLY